jgi:hypothetical protein
MPQAASEIPASTSPGPTKEQAVIEAYASQAAGHQDGVAQSNARPDRENRGLDGVGVATTNDFGAKSSRPPSLLSSLVTWPGARLATGPPATTLTGLDSHQLDSFEGFHQLMSDPPSRAFPTAIARELFGQPCPRQ